MKTLKRALSLFLAAALLVSLLAIPAAAADPFTVSVSNTSANAGATNVYLDISVAGNPGFTSMDVRVYYKSSVLTCTAVAASKDSANNPMAWKDFADAESDEGRTATAALNKDDPSCSAARTNAGWKLASLGYISQSPFTADGVVGRLAFTVASDSESCELPIEVEVVGGTAADGTSALVLPSTTNGMITVSGVTPTINIVTLAKSSVTVDGTNGATVQATVKSAKGTDITNNVTWSVSPAGQGVSIAADGEITVDAKAKGGVYTVTASGKTDCSCGESTKSLQVNRAAAEPASIVISGPDTVEIPTKAACVSEYNFGSAGMHLAKEVADYNAVVYDQYGDEVESPTVTWGVETTQAPVLSIIYNASGKLVLPCSATTGKITVTATCGGIKATKNVDVTKDNPVPTTVTVSGADTVTIPAGDTPASETYTATVYDQYGTAMDGQNVTWSVSSATGVSINNGALSVDKTATANEITVTAKVGAKEGNKTVNLQSIAFANTTPPTLKQSPVYGDKWSEIVTNIGTYTAKVGGQDVAGTYTLKDADSVPASGEQTYTILFNSNDQTYKNVVAATDKVTVAPRTLTVNTGTMAVTKTYDGTTNVASTDLTGNLGFSGAVNGEGGDGKLYVAFTGAQFDSKDVDSASKVTFSGLTIEGSQAGNYTLDKTSIEIAATISPKTITAADLEYKSGAKTKEYDGSDASGITVQCKSGVLASGDTLDIPGSAKYNSENVVSANKVTFTTTAITEGNYRLAAELTLDVAATITAKTLTVLPGTLVITKEYDGTTNAGTAAQDTALALGGVVGGDTVTVTYATVGKYAAANVGTGLNVTLSGLALDGADKANYQLSAASLQVAAGEITKAAPTAAHLTVSNTSKVYNGQPQQPTVALKSDYTGMGTITVNTSATNVSDGEKAITVSIAEGSNFTAAANVALTETFKITPKSIANVTVEGIESNGYEYTGNEIEPAITVKDGQATLTKDTDYTLTYANNTNVGTAAKITVTGKGNYDSATKKEVTFKITKTQPVKDTDYTVTLPTELGYSGLAKTATVAKTNESVGNITVKYNGQTTAPKNAGTYAVTVDIAESANFSAMTAVDCGSFTITPKALSISSVAVADKGYNGKTDDASVTGVTFTGLVDGESLALGTDYTVTATYTNANSSDSAAVTGTVTLTETTAAKNYSLDNGAFATTGKVTPTTTTLTLSAANVTYTGAAYAGTLTQDNNVSTTPTYTYYTDAGCTTKTTSGNSGAASEGAAPVSAGTYYVKGVIAQSTNYTAADATASFTITPAPLTITAKDHTITYGDAPANNGVEYSDFVGGETSAVVSGLAYTISYEQFGNFGEYTITPKDATAANYDITFVSGKLTVEQKEVGLTWSDVSNLYYDGTAKSITATVTGAVNGDEVLVNVVGGAQTAIGSYTAKVTGLTGAAAANYKLPTNESVNKAYTIVAVLDTVAANSDGGALTADVDGLTVKLSGYVAADKNITLTAEKDKANVTITDGATIAATNIGKDKTNTFTASGVTYTVDTSAVVVKPANVEIAAEAKSTPTDISEVPEEAKTAGVDETVVNVLNDNNTKGDGLTEAAPSVIENAVAEGKAAAAAELGEKAADVDKVEVEFGLKIEPTAYTSGTSLTLKLQPVVTYTFKDSGGNVITDDSSQPITSEKVVANSKLVAPITISVKLPAAFPTTNLYARHYLNAEKTKFEMIPVTVVGGVATWHQKTFSEVELVADTRTATVNFTFEDEHGQTITFAPEDIGTAFPTDSRSGYTFNGWKFGDNNTAYKTLDDTLLTALNGETVTATPTFTQNSSGNYGGGGGGAVAKTAEVSVAKADNGTVSADVTKAKAGDTVTVTVAPKDGYKLDKLTVTDANGKTVALKKVSDTKYTFTMPDGKVSIAATFVESKTETAMSFTDVKANDWYYDAVKYAFDNGLMNGTGDEKFSPNATTTRGMIFTVLARNAGVDTTGGETWYTVGMNWAKAQGISDGTMPEGNITREQLATMLYRVAKNEGKGFTGSWMFLLDYPDAAEISDWADEAMHWCVMKGIVNGKDGKLVPTGNATRAEVATMLMRFLELDK